MPARETTKRWKSIDHSINQSQRMQDDRTDETKKRTFLVRTAYLIQRSHGVPLVLLAGQFSGISRQRGLFHRKAQRRSHQQITLPLWLGPTTVDPDGHGGALLLLSVLGNVWFAGTTVASIAAAGRFLDESAKGKFKEIGPIRYLQYCVHWLIDWFWYVQWLNFSKFRFSFVFPTKFPPLTITIIVIRFQNLFESIVSLVKSFVNRETNHGVSKMVPLIDWLTDWCIFPRCQLRVFGEKNKIFYPWARQNLF